MCKGKTALSVITDGTVFTLRLLTLGSILIHIFVFPLPLNNLLFSLIFGQCFFKKCIQLIPEEHFKFFLTTPVWVVQSRCGSCWPFSYIRGIQNCWSPLLRSLSLGYRPQRFGGQKLIFENSSSLIYLICVLYVFFGRWGLPFDFNVFYVAKSLCSALLPY